MANEFEKAVEEGIGLSRRIYYGKDRSVASPKPFSMEKSYLPTSPMVYAVITDPSIVDNPDVPSYQPYVHGRCDTPALIPLQMNRIGLEVDVFLDTAFVTVTGSWRVHCVMGSKSCSCRIAIAMGEQGIIQDVEVQVPKKLYRTEWVVAEEKKDAVKVARPEEGGFLKPNIFILTVPQVDGGSNISIKASWSQKVLSKDGIFSVTIPFSFPEYVTPTGKKLSKKEKISLNVNPGTGTEVLCNTCSHSLKELRRVVGKLSFLSESEVTMWSHNDFIFSYNVSSSHIFGGVILQSPSVHDVDQRNMFCFYLYPGHAQDTKVFRKDVVFAIDISGSMRGKPLEDTINALSAALIELNAEDTFNIIGFNGETIMFSSSMELATEKVIGKATEWIKTNLIAGGETNILTPLTKAIDMLSDVSGSIPTIFLVTDGAVDNERHICDVTKTRLLMDRASICPRIYTFGIGSYCNHYFLKMLATIGRGRYDFAYDADSIENRMQKLLGTSVTLADINIDSGKDLDFEVYPSHIPDLSSDCPLTVSGRYKGDFPEVVKAKGILPNFNNFSLDLKLHKSKEMPLEKVLLRLQIDYLTSQAWFSEDKQLEEKVAKMSLQSGVMSEYTGIVLAEADQDGTVSNDKAIKKADSKKQPDFNEKKIIWFRVLGVGFGNLALTAENMPPGFEEQKPPEAAEIFAMAASNCCGRMCEICCCRCGIEACSRVNDHCAILIAQICTALAFLGCFECCATLCCSGSDGR